MLLPLFHLSVVLFNGFSLYYDQYHLDVPLPDNVKESLHKLPFRGRILFLTMWGLTFQTIYFTLALLNDIFGSNARRPKKEKTPSIRLIKDTLFSLVFPLSLFIAIAFWSIYFYDSELILPIHIRKHFPVWLNHAMHTTIVPFVILELILSPITYPSKPIGISIGILFILSYVSVLITAYISRGSLVYKVLDVMSGPLKIAFIAASAVFGLFLYFVGDFLNGLLNPKVSEKGNVSKTSSKTKKKKRID